jgi:hypothetical protein
MEKEPGIMPEAIDNELARTKKRLIDEAMRRHGNDIVYVGNKKNWDECFTVENGEVLLWFNTKKDSSTCMLRETELPD